MDNNFHTVAAQLIDAGRALHAMGMVPATSGNFSALLDDGHIAITVFIIDIEASGFGGMSYPIEVGIALETDSKYCSLILPAPDWIHWDHDQSPTATLTKLTGIRFSPQFNH